MKSLGDAKGNTSLASTFGEKRDPFDANPWDLTARNMSCATCYPVPDNT